MYESSTKETKWREKGVISRLREMGIKENDTVIVGDVEFDFVN